MSDVNAAATWEATLGQLQLQVTRANFDTWLRDTIGLRHEDDRIVVGAQNDFATEWLATRLKPLIVKTIARVLGRPIDVAFEVLRNGEAEPPLLAPAGAPPEAYRRPATPPPALNPRLTFDSFVVGDENRIACEAARRAVEEPGAVNPLLIFGPTGMGKTHLLHAIGHAAHEGGRSVVFAPAERFANDYVRALHANGFDAFRARYRTPDALLIDDFQFFEGREKFQEEFFHAFNDLHAAGKQIVVSIDRRPAELGGIMDRLLSRICWGLVVDVARPEYETRLAILRSKARHHALKLPEEALRAIAERCCPSVRELEGYLNRVLAYVPLIGGRFSQDVVEKALSPLVGPREQEDAAPPTSDVIVEAVSRRTGFRPGELRGASRSRNLSYARHLAMYVLKENGGRSVAEIGRLLGNRDHATVLAGVKRVALELATRPETREDLRAVREGLAPAPDARAS